MSLPLRGVRVVELGLWVAGPAAAAILADWGADVLKVEPPDGDPFRRIFQALAGLRTEGAPPFEFDNRGKRSRVLDLKREEARAELERELAAADVFVSNYRRSALARLGLAPEELRRRHPRLVVCHVSGYGARGPEADRHGYDVAAFWARSGAALSMTPEGAEIPLMRGGFGDHTTALAAVGGICAALAARARSGQGELVETSLLRTGAYVMGWDTAVQLHYGKLAPPERRSAPMNPLINPYRAGDGRWFWILGLEADRHWPATARALGHPEWLADPRFAGAAERRRHARELVALLDEAFARHGLAHWAGAFDREGVWWAPVQSTAELVRDPQAEAAGVFVELPPAEPGGPPGRSVASPVDFGGETPRPRGPAPALGAAAAPPGPSDPREDGPPRSRS